MGYVKGNIFLPFFALLFAAFTSLFIVSTGIKGIAALIFVPLGGIYFWYLMTHPNKALFSTLVFAFISIGVTRYMPQLPLGLTVDFGLAMAIISGIFHTRVETDFTKIKNGLVLVCLIWMGYNIAQLLNPEARSMAAWIYAVRGSALYMVMTVPLTLLYADNVKKLDTFLKTVFIFSLFAALWGLKQHFIGLDAAEIRWLDQGSRSTHVLFGNLRIFSFFSDAGQFGAGIAHTGVMALVLALGPFQIKTRIIALFCALLFFYLMILSGTRGALMVPFAGIAAYLIATKNFKIMAAGLLGLTLLFMFLKFSTVGNESYQIRRMRSALDPQDASLNVRKVNQRKFAAYLATRPFGGGIGTSGYWGQRFSPGTFLADTPNDSWFIKIWAETGIIGLVLYMGILGYIGLMALFRIWKVRDPRLKQKLLALLAGYAGIGMASIGNPLLGQMPTGIILYMSWAYLYLAPELDKQISTAKTQRTNDN